jgi:hypothetical protein
MKILFHLKELYIFGACRNLCIIQSGDDKTALIGNLLQAVVSGCLGAMLTIG